MSANGESVSSQCGMVTTTATTTTTFGFHLSRLPLCS